MLSSAPKLLRVLLFAFLIYSPNTSNAQSETDSSFTLLGQLDIIGNITDFTLDNQTLFLAIRNNPDNYVVSVDLSDPSNPTPLDTIGINNHTGFT